jgi:anaerobic selenocysteine-containing dehydrogenase
VLMSGDDARRLGLEHGDSVVLTNELGELRGRVCVAPMSPGNLEVHWPEGEVLIERRRRSPQAGIPDYNAIVRVERIEEREPVTA